MREECSEARFSALLQDFFCQRLIAQRNVSAQTISSYRDTFRLLLRYSEQHIKKAPTALTLRDLNAPFIVKFLEHLEKERGNSVRSRNLRLTAIRSFMRYVALQDPTCLPIVERVLAIPTKHFDRPFIDFLSREEMEAVLSAPDLSTWSGHRDHVMFSTFYNTGARVSEIINLRVCDVRLKPDASIHLTGKGRKQRVVPLWKRTTASLRQWNKRVGGVPEAPVFPNREGNPLSRSGIEHRLQLAVQQATKNCATLEGRKISPHTLRHTTAMHLLQSGVDITVIALWLGHESITTTHLYVEADLKMKERALRTIQEPPIRRVRYRPSDCVLAFLDSL